MTDYHVDYRPREFSEVIGQDHIIKSLMSFEKENSWPHAYIFQGVYGAGKTTLARIIASKLGCSEAPNLLEIDAASHSGADNARSLISNLNYSGFGSKSANRAIIIDECHSLSKQAWQVFLKTVEEPPDHVYFFFCTTDMAKIPETIASRCHRYTVKEISELDLAELLDVVAENEGLELPEEAIDLIASEARGSARMALTMLSSVRSAKTVDEVRVGIESAQSGLEMNALCKLLLSGNATWEGCLRIIRKLEIQNVESLRLGIIAYLSKVLLSTDDEQKAEIICAAIHAFSKPYNPSEKIAPLLLSIGELTLYGED